MAQQSEHFKCYMHVRISTMTFMKYIMYYIIFYKNEHSVILLVQFYFCNTCIIKFMTKLCLAGTSFHLF